MKHLAPAALLAFTMAVSGNCRLCLYGPDNMVFDRSGNVYLVDTDHRQHSRVLKLSPDGAVLGDWRVFAQAPGDRNGPEGIAIDSAGEVFVTDAGRQRVLVLSPQGALLRMVGASPASFPDLGHIAIDGDNNVYIAQAGPNLIEKFASDGRLVGSWQLERSPLGPAAFAGPQTIAARADGTVVVEHWPMRRVDVFSPAGQLIFAFGHKGADRGGFMETAGLAVDRAGNIYVADIALHRVQKFDSQGRWVATIGNSPEDNLFGEGPGSVAVDRDGNLYSADGSSVVKYAQDGTVLARWQ
jgi:sugar lactone lactonase YvrE